MRDLGNLHAVDVGDGLLRLVLLRGEQKARRHGPPRNVHRLRDHDVPRAARPRPRDEGGVGLRGVEGGERGEQKPRAEERAAEGAQECPGGGREAQARRAEGLDGMNGGRGPAGARRMNRGHGGFLGKIRDAGEFNRGGRWTSGLQGFGAAPALRSPRPFEDRPEASPEKALRRSPYAKGLRRRPVRPGIVKRCPRAGRPPEGIEPQAPARGFSPQQNQGKGLYPCEAID